MCNAYNHPPDCTCGFGGEGHLGSGGGNYGGIGIGHYTYSEQFKDVCYSTKCPINGCEPVWFIRHNGGSVWVDQLGWPWPKHGCFDEPSNDDPYACVSVLAKNQGGLTSPKLGLLNSISGIGSPQGPKLQIGSLDGSLITVHGDPDKNYYQLLGELIIFSQETGLLRHSKWGDFPIFPFKPKREWVQCKCKCWVEKKYLVGHLQFYRCGESKMPVTGTSDPTTDKTKNLSQIKVKSGKKEKRIRFAIERIIKEAWRVTSASANADTNFRLVKQEAIRLMRGLSPHIRREVEQYFTSRKWSPLVK